MAEIKDMIAQIGAMLTKRKKSLFPTKNLLQC